MFNPPKHCTIFRLKPEATLLDLASPTRELEPAAAADVIKTPPEFPAGSAVTSVTVLLMRPKVATAGFAVGLPANARSSGDAEVGAVRAR